MRLILEYTLPDERAEAYLAQYGEKFYFAVCEFGEWLRSQDRYHELSDEERTYLEKVKEAFYDALEERGLRIDEEPGS